MSVDADVNGKRVEAIIDTGATLSVVAKAFVQEKSINRGRTIPVEVGSGETPFTLGTTTLVLTFGDKVIEHEAHVLNTTAFQAVLGMDFLQGPRCTGILTYPTPPKLLIDGELFPLNELQGKQNSSQKGFACSKRKVPLWCRNFGRKLCNFLEPRGVKLPWIFLRTTSTTKKSCFAQEKTRRFSTTGKSCQATEKLSGPTHLSVNWKKSL